MRLRRTGLVAREHRKSSVLSEWGFSFDPRRCDERPSPGPRLTARVGGVVFFLLFHVQH